MQSQVINKPRNEGRIASPEDIRYWTMASLAAGASGFMYLRWRPLLDGPLFGAFGPYGMDGSRTARSDMVCKLGQWIQAPEQSNLRKSRPVKGEVGIIFVPETQLFTYAQQGNTHFYSQAMQGAYRGFFDNNIQADWVYIDDIDRYRFLYLPFPVMLNKATADRLENGSPRAARWWPKAARLTLATAATWEPSSRTSNWMKSLGRARVTSNSPRICSEICGCRSAVLQFGAGSSCRRISQPPVQPRLV